MRFLLIGCEILTRELARAAADSPATVDLLFLEKGLHDRGPKAMRKRIQEEIDKADPSRHDAVVLGYALCGTGLAGLRAGALPVVAPRAHDCIGLLLGSAAKHEAMQREEPGTYFRSCGWVERAADMAPLALAEMGTGMSLAAFEENAHDGLGRGRGGVRVRDGLGAASGLCALMEKYGEENGFYLYQEFTRYQRNYSRLVFIRTTGAVEDAEGRAREEAGEKGWRFESLAGDMGWFARLAAGDWNEREFVVVKPGETIEARHDGSIMAAVREEL